MVKHYDFVKRITRVQVKLILEREDVDALCLQIKSEDFQLGSLSPRRGCLLFDPTAFWEHSYENFMNVSFFLFLQHRYLVISLSLYIFFSNRIMMFLPPFFRMIAHLLRAFVTYFLGFRLPSLASRVHTEAIGNEVLLVFPSIT